MKNISLIVAKYKEDLSWTKSLKNKYNIFVYDKNNNFSKDDFDIDPVYRNDNNKIFCSLPNIGRESHTYLYHIVKNYHKLNDINIFIQGNPFDHVSDIFEKIENNLNKDFYPLSRIVTQKKQDFINQLDDKISFYYGNQYSLYKELFNKELPEKYSVGIHGMFIVSKETILKNDIKIYEQCLDKFNSKKYLTGFCMTDLNEYNCAKCFNKNIYNLYNGIPNGEGFAWMFEYFWDLLFHKQINL